MEYFFGLPLAQQDVVLWYQHLLKTLYERFGGKPLHAHIPPHVTVIPPFDEVHLPAVRACVARWKQEGNEGPWTVSLDGFGSFEQGVVFGRIRDASIYARGNGASSCSGVRGAAYARTALS
ncbi:2'-5' RNA ligase family protein [Patescibacteria group bacterium]|nr:2'-5' RNA ligase family protein [Patescibacteria group bacterium]